MQHVLSEHNKNLYSQRSIRTHSMIRMSFVRVLFNIMSIYPIDMILIVNISPQAQVLDNIWI